MGGFLLQRYILWNQLSDLPLKSHCSVAILQLFCCNERVSQWGFVFLALKLDLLQKSFSFRDSVSPQEIFADKVDIWLVFQRCTNSPRWRVSRVAPGWPCHDSVTVVDWLSRCCDGFWLVGFVSLACFVRWRKLWNDHAAWQLQCCCFLPHISTFTFYSLCINKLLLFETQPRYGSIDFHLLFISDDLHTGDKFNLNKTTDVWTRPKCYRSLNQNVVSRNFWRVCYPCQCDFPTDFVNRMFSSLKIS